MVFYLNGAVVLASGTGNDVGLTKILLLVFFLGIAGILIRKITENKEEKIGSAITDGGRNEETSNSLVAHNEIIDSETLDEKYAQENNMWVCAYCETLNPCLPGDEVIKDNTRSPKEETGMTKSTLRGDLLIRRNAKMQNEADRNEQPVCIACGKRRHRHE